MRAWGHYSALVFWGYGFLCQHRHSMKVRTSSPETEGEKIKGKVSSRRERFLTALPAQFAFLLCRGRVLNMGGRRYSRHHGAAVISIWVLFNRDRCFRPRFPPIVVVGEGKGEAFCVFFHVNAIVPNCCLSLCWLVIKERGII